MMVGFVVDSQDAFDCFVSKPSSLKKVAVGRMMVGFVVDSQDAFDCCLIALSQELVSSPHETPTEIEKDVSARTYFPTYREPLTV